MEVGYLKQSNMVNDFDLLLLTVSSIKDMLDLKELEWHLKYDLLYFRGKLYFLPGVLRQRTV